MTPKAGVFLVSATLLLLGCQSPMPDPAFGALERGPLSVLVVPLNVTIRPPEGLEAETDPVWEALIAYLRSFDLEPSALSVARSTVFWEEVVTELGGSDAGADLRTAWSRFAQRVGTGTPHEWVIVPSLVLRRAGVSGHQVYWDGAHRDLQVPFALDQRSRPGPGIGSSASFQGYSGALAAASLHVAILTNGGKLVWEGLGGLVLVVEIDPVESTKRNTWWFQPRPEPFEDSDHVRAGVALAFARRLPGAPQPGYPDAVPIGLEQTQPPANSQ
jgi:hypothetical protein